MCHLCPANDVNKPDTEQLTSEATTEFSKHENHSYVKKTLVEWYHEPTASPPRRYIFELVTAGIPDASLCNTCDI